MTHSKTTTCHYPECHYAHCRDLFIVVLSVIMPHVVVQSVVVVSVVAMFVCHTLTLQLNKTAQLALENLAQTTFSESC